MFYLCCTVALGAFFIQYYKLLTGILFKSCWSFEFCWEASSLTILKRFKPICISLYANCSWSFFKRTHCLFLFVELNKMWISIPYSPHTKRTRIFPFPSYRKIKARRLYMDRLPLASYTLPVYSSPMAQFLIDKQTNKKHCQNWFAWLVLGSVCFVPCCSGSPLLWMILLLLELTFTLSA